MKQIRKSFSVLIKLFLLIILFTACGSSNTNSSQSQTTTEPNEVFKDMTIYTIPIGASIYLDNSGSEYLVIDYENEKYTIMYSNTTPYKVIKAKNIPFLIYKISIDLKLGLSGDDYVTAYTRDIWGDKIEEEDELVEEIEINNDETIDESEEDESENEYETEGF